MKPTYYYPTKLPLAGRQQDEDEAKEDIEVVLENEFYDRKWRRRSKKLQKRRWQKIHHIEYEENEKKQYRLQKIRQKRWLQAHGWPSIAQPLV